MEFMSHALCRVSMDTPITLAIFQRDETLCRLDISLPTDYLNPVQAVPAKTMNHGCRRMQSYRKEDEGRRLDLLAGLG